MSAVALGLGLLAALVSQPAETPAPAVYPVYFVSPEGDDALPGLAPERTADGSDGPFRSIQRAQEVLRGLAQPDGHPNGAVVYLREGTYALSEPIVFGPQDSGRDKRPVMFRNYTTEAVRVTGGVRVSAFEPHEGSIVKAKVADLLPPGFRPTALYCDGERQHLSRWPNAGEGELPGGGWTFVKASDDSLRKQRFFYSSDRPAKWAGQSGVEVSIWPNYNWWQTITGVKAIDTTAGTVELSTELPYTIEPGRRLFFQNIFSELDSPGEWWYDMAEGMLYFWPPKELANAEVMIPVAPALFRVEGAQNLNLMGMTLEMTTGEAVTMKDATACLFAKSTVRNVDGFGVTVSGGAHCRVLGNDVYQTGRGAIELTGGDRKTLTRANHQAINNHIHDFGVLYQTYQTGVNVNGVGNIVAHNLIHDAPHIGILLTGNEHIIEYNDIHHVCLQGSDNGGFYMGRDWTQRGNKIRYNKFHDIYGFGLSGLGADGEGVYQYETPHQAWGIYLDDCSSGTTVYGNWFYRVPLCGVMIGGGRDNVVENNIFVDCTPALHIDNRWDAYPWDLMNERLEAMNPTQPPYSEAYPELLKMGDDPRKPENNRFVRNIVYYAQDSYRGLSTTAEHPEKAVVYNLDHFDPASTVIDENLLFHEDLPIRIAWSEYGVAESGKTLTWQDWREKGFDKKSVVKKPMFVDPDRDDYTLAPASPAKEIGFKPIAAHLMGLIDDEFRVSPAPARDERRDGAKHQRFPVKVE